MPPKPPAPPTLDTPTRIAEIVLVLILLSGIFSAIGMLLDRFGISPGKAFKKFDTVMTTEVTRVLELPSGVVLGTQLAKARGVLTDGPQVFESARYWFVDFAADPDGWVNEDALTFPPESFHLGSHVKGEQTHDVYQVPNGSVLGSQTADIRGTLTQGPSTDENGVTWWYVDYESGVDGWVRADDLVSDEKVTRTDVLKSRLSGPLLSLWNTVSTIILFLSLILGTGVVYLSIRIKQLVELNEIAHKRRLLEQQEKTETDPRFEHIQSLSSSMNPSDWRQAIIEADILLDELLGKFGYPGSSVGDKLKQVRTGDLSTLQSAWEAHKVRNDIAHRGSDFILTQREAKRTLDLYRQVFSELGLFS